MAQTLDVHPLETRVGDFIAGLHSLEKEPITTARVSDFLAQMQLSGEAIAPYLLWNRETYARNLIFRDDFFKVLALCWLPGQRTPIHSHDGQLGWVTVVQGELVSRDYKFVRAQPEESPRRGLGTTARRPVEVELLGSTTRQADGSVALVDRVRTTHRIENLEHSQHGSVSLHVYSKPINSCALFDETSRCCERRQLRYYSAGGVILKPELQAA